MPYIIIYIYTHLQSQLMESVVLKFLQDVANDPDPDVRCRAAEVLVQLLVLCSSTWGTQLLAILNSILQKGLQVASKAMKDKVGVAWVESESDSV